MKAAKTEAVDRFALVRAATTSGEFRVAIEQLTRDLATLKAEHAEAEQARDKGILDNGDMPALRAAVVSLADQISDTQAAIGEAGKRQAEAEKREAETGIADIRSEAEGVSAELGELYKRFDGALLTLRQAAAELDRKRTRLAAINDRLEALGRPGLRIKTGMVRSEHAPTPTAVMAGLSVPARRVDDLLRRLGLPGQAIRVEPRRTRIAGTGATPAVSMSADGMPVRGRMR